MINYETILFIDLLNKLAEEYTEKSKFLPLDPQNVSTEEKLLCAVGGMFCYDKTNVAFTDVYVKFYPLIHKWKKNGDVIYYPNTYVGVADENEKEPDEPVYSLWTFTTEDHDWDKVIGYDGEGSWRFVENI